MKTQIYFPPKDRMGLLYLLALIILGNIGLNSFKKAVSFSEEEKLQLISSLLEKQQAKSDPKTPTNDLAKSPKATIPFNPNLISVDDLIEYGMSKHAATNLEKYRRAGGVIYSTKDLEKIYGMDSLWLASTNHLITYPSRKIKKRKATTSIKESAPVPTQASATKINPRPIPSKVIIQAVTFDPNTATMPELLGQGLSKYAANNLIKYRSKGGKIYKTSDLLKIYGVDSTIFSKIAPNVIIKAQESVLSNSTMTDVAVSPTPSLTDSANPKIEKIDLNNTTAEALIALRGIGPVLSERIIDYKDRLGGYVSTLQIKEIYALSEETYESIKDQLTVTGPVEKIYIPSHTFKKVLSHPYIDYETTKLLKNTSIMIFDEKLEEYIKDGKIDERVLPYIHRSDPNLISLLHTE